jgi:AraC-like DNA-binding protein
MTARLLQVPPPVQPAVHSLVEGCGIAERVLPWNDRNLKNMAYFSEFVARAGGPAEVDLYPDSCTKVFFECGPGGDAAFVHGANTEITLARLKPGCRYFLFVPYSSLALDMSAPPAEFVNRRAPFGEAFRRGGPLAEAVRGAPGFDARVMALIGNARCILRGGYEPALSEHLAVAMCISRGAMRVGDLEGYTGYSERHCRDVFKKDYGIALKRYCRILRFQGALRGFCGEAGGERGLKVLDDCGYYDQAHFIKDFKGFARETPRLFAKRMRAGALGKAAKGGAGKGRPEAG